MGKEKERGRGTSWGPLCCPAVSLPIYLTIFTRRQPNYKAATTALLTTHSPRVIWFAWSTVQLYNGSVVHQRKTVKGKKLFPFTLHYTAPKTDEAHVVSCCAILFSVDAIFPCLFLCPSMRKKKKKKKQWSAFSITEAKQKRVTVQISIELFVIVRVCVFSVRRMNQCICRSAAARGSEKPLLYDKSTAEQLTPTPPPPRPLRVSSLFNEHTNEQKQSVKVGSHFALFQANRMNHPGSSEWKTREMVEK